MTMHVINPMAQMNQYLGGQERILGNLSQYGDGLFIENPEIASKRQADRSLAKAAQQRAAMKFPITNEVFNSDPNSKYAYRVIGDTEVDDIIKHGEARAPEKSRGGRFNTKHWQTSNAEVALDRNNIIRVSNDKIKLHERVKARDIESWDKTTQSFKSIVPKNTGLYKDMAKNAVRFLTGPAALIAEGMLYSADVGEGSDMPSQKPY